ncbi:MAG: RNA methyltransferase [Deltaproteobacteria bacterium]|nr:RNA methyltransferase [Deltaproteobacteria bacterium]
MPDGVDVRSLDEATLSRIIETLEGYVTSQRRDRIRSVVSSRTRDVVLVIEHLRNPHNAAAVFRTAEAFGFFEVHAIPEKDQLDVSARVSSGSHKWLELHSHRSIEDAYSNLAGRGYRVLASAIRGDAIAVSELDVTTPIALVFGNERDGLSKVAIDTAHGRFRIPMFGFVESFNISVAAAVTAYEVTKRRAAVGLLPSMISRDRLALHAVYLTRSLESSRALLGHVGLPVPILHETAIRLKEEE